MLLFTLDGTDYEFDDDELDVDEALDIQKYAGIGIGDFVNTVREVNPRGLKAMVWLARRRTGEDVKWSDVKFDVFALLRSLRRPENDEADESEDVEAEEIPTTPEPSANGSGTGTTPQDGEPATSEHSPSTSD